MRIYGRVKSERRKEGIWNEKRKEKEGSGEKEGRV